MSYITRAIADKNSMNFDNEFTIRQFRHIMEDIPEAGNKVEHLEINHWLIGSMIYDFTKFKKCYHLRINTVLFTEILFNFNQLTKLEIIDTDFVDPGTHTSLIAKCTHLESLTFIVSKTTNIDLTNLMHLKLKEFDIGGNLFICSHFKYSLAVFLKSQAKTLEKLALHLFMTFGTLEYYLQCVKFEKLKEIYLISIQMGEYINHAVCLFNYVPKIIILNYSIPQSMHYMQHLIRTNKTKEVVFLHFE